MQKIETGKRLDARPVYDEGLIVTLTDTAQGKFGCCRPICGRVLISGYAWLAVEWATRALPRWIPTEDVQRVDWDSLRELAAAGSGVARRALRTRSVVDVELALDAAGKVPGSVLGCGPFEYALDHDLALDDLGGILAHAVERGLRIDKYSDPVEGYRQGLTAEEALEISWYDSSLIRIGAV